MSATSALITPVPDNDIVPRRIRRPWKPAAELAIGGKAADLVVDECGRALAREIRESGLAPAVVDLAKALDAAVSAGRPEPFYAAAEVLRDRVDVSPLASSVLAEGEFLLETSLNGYRDALAGGAIEPLINGSLRRFTESALFGSQEMRQRMHRETGKSLSELDSYTSQVLSDLPVSEIARSMVNRPDGEVRAPARTAKATMPEMLGEKV